MSAKSVVPAFILRVTLAEVLRISPEAISYRIKKGLLPPLDCTINRSRGWCRDTLAEADPGLFKVISLHYADQQ